jgi:endonuclease/exonuclease/phosphatase family metal-dependent hydrolase
MKTRGPDAIRIRDPRLICATWNIHGCIGRDRRHDPERTRCVLREFDADLVALQEVEDPHEAPGLLEFLTSGSDWSVVSGPTLLRPTGQYGNALLSRLPIVHHDRVDLSLPGREPRGAIRIMVRWNDLKVQLLATHLGLRPQERRIQITRLLRLIRHHAATERPDITVLAGDLNEWFLWGRPLRWLRGHFGSAPSPRSFPAGWPVLPLDRIWVDPPERLVNTRTWTSGLARMASDHLPVLATLQQPAKPHGA